MWPRRARDTPNTTSWSSPEQRCWPRPMPYLNRSSSYCSKNARNVGRSGRPVSRPDPSPPGLSKLPQSGMEGVSMVINTNISAQTSAQLLGQSSSMLSKSLARLSSGSKISSPADDSAGLAVSMKLNAQMSRVDAATSNVGNAVSFNQTQDGYLQKVSDALNRMSELAILAQDVTKTSS